MAKSKKNPPVQSLSPENYICKKARTLPIYECLVNEDWEETGTASVLVSRIHTNGNLTFGMYLVDLYCLGIKETLYRFNNTKSEYLEFIEMANENINTIKIDYTLAHNIIFAGNEYAAELGFKPHKTFTSLTQYLLEEDTDEVELIDINCGFDGKPMFIKTEFVPKAESDRIIAQLNRTVGKGNYNVILHHEDPDFDFDEEYEDDEDFDDENNNRHNLMEEYNLLTFDERISIFNELICNELNNMTEDEIRRLVILTDSIFFSDLCDQEEVEDLCLRWSSDVNVEIDENYYTWESLGLESKREISLKEQDEFNELDNLVETQSKKVKKRLEKLRKKWGNIPYLDYVELNYLEVTDSKLFKAKIDELKPKLMNYPLFKMDLHKNKAASNIDENDMIDLLNIDKIFDGRESISPKEMILYLTNKCFTIEARGNKNEIEAMYILIDDMDLDDTIVDMLNFIISVIRINMIRNIISEK